MSELYFGVDASRVDENEESLRGDNLVLEERKKLSSRVLVPLVGVSIDTGEEVGTFGFVGVRGIAGASKDRFGGRGLMSRPVMEIGASSARCSPFRLRSFSCWSSLVVLVEVIATTLPSARSFFSRRSFTVLVAFETWAKLLIPPRARGLGVPATFRLFVAGGMMKINVMVMRLLCCWGSRRIRETLLIDLQRNEATTGCRCGE